MKDMSQALIILLLIVINGIFALSEVALVAARPGCTNLPGGDHKANSP